MHYNPEAVRHAKESDVILFTLVPHTTHEMQPLDTAVFGPQPDGEKLVTTIVVREIFAYRNFHVLIFCVKKFSDIVYLSEKFLTRNLNTSSLLVNGKQRQGT